MKIGVWFYGLGTILTGIVARKQLGDCRTLAAGIASCPLRRISPRWHSRLREHRPTLDGVWIFLGGADRDRLLSGRVCNLLSANGCSGCQASCVDAVAL